MLPTEFDIKVEDVERWEKQIRKMAMDYEKRGEEEKAKMYYTCASLLWEYVIFQYLGTENPKYTC